MTASMAGRFAGFILPMLAFLIICGTRQVSSFQQSRKSLKQHRQCLRGDQSVARSFVSPRQDGRNDPLTRRWAETTSAASSPSTKEEMNSKLAENACDEMPQIGKENSSVNGSTPLSSQVFSSGYSQSIDLTKAIEEAVAMALEGLPPTSTGEGDGTKTSQIDLAIISVNSLYDGSGAGISSTASLVIPTLLNAAQGYGSGIQHVIGSSSGGVIGSRVVTDTSKIQNQNEKDGDADDKNKNGSSNDRKNIQESACHPLEQEGVPCVSVTLCILPDVNIETFYVTNDEVPDNWDRLNSKQWKNSIGWTSSSSSSSCKEDGSSVNDESVDAVFLLPSPAFSTELDDLLGGMEMHLSSTAIPSTTPTIFGAVASTVSSLSRARLFRYDCRDPDGLQAAAGGCVGVKFSGDIQVRTIIAQGAKPVGGVYQIVKGQDSTISAVALDETATELIRQAEEEDGHDTDGTQDNEDEIDVSSDDRASQLAALYAKARIPKPVLAEANFLMRTLSDDDQAFMRQTLLVGLERCGALGRTNSELSRLAEGKGYAFDVHPVASAAMKDGSVTLSLGSVSVEPGTQMRFFVREAEYAKREIEALWTGFKARNILDSQRNTSADEKSKASFQPTCCLIFPTLDRGNKFFRGKSGFESTTVSRFLPGLSSISGFFCNGVIGSLNTAEEKRIGMNDDVNLIGSATSYVLIGSKSNRPIFKAGKSTAATRIAATDDSVLKNDGSSAQSYMSLDPTSRKAPRDNDGELILKRREVHSGRALTVSTVEWSVAEKTARPSSTLEGFMWDKETEVDRFRERVPLANLLSQVKLYTLDPSKPKPRDWVGSIAKAAGLDDNNDGKRRFVIIPECKRQEPQSGSLRKRYDVSKLAREFSTLGVPAISINCDAVMFGGSLDDVTKAREGTPKMVLDSAGNLVPEKSTSEDELPPIPPILASDLLLYPYQLYKIRLVGADAVNLIVGALASKDLVYLTKIASSLQMQSLLTVTSIAQLQRVMVLPPNSFDGLVVSNRQLEDFSFDMTGNQALEILKSSELESFREKHGHKVPILVEGRIGIIRHDDAANSDDNMIDPVIAYIKKLEDAGAIGAIVGGGIAENDVLLQRFAVATD